MDSYFSLLILSCLHKVKNERTVYSIFHLLKGKKSSQTIQDAHLFQLTNLFQTFPQLSREYFDEIILGLERKQMISESDREKYRITDRGLEALNETLEMRTIPWLNGWKYCSIQADFWKRLSLMVQVSSNLIHYETSYIPIQNDFQTSDWLKKTLRHFSHNRELLAEKLLHEITFCLSDEKNIIPEVLILRLTGYKQIGLTQKQAADFLQMDLAFFHLQFLNTIHYMIDKILSNRTEFPILEQLLFDYQMPIVLTKSTSITYKYLSFGHSIEEIAAIRNLKQSTVEDHLVEIALNDNNFFIEPFVPTDVQRDIINSIKRLSSKQLKYIRQDLLEKVTYFQIRLVLAKFGDQL